MSGWLATRAQAFLKTLRTGSSDRFTLTAGAQGISLDQPFAPSFFLNESDGTKALKAFQVPLWKQTQKIYLEGLC